MASHVGTSPRPPPGAAQPAIFHHRTSSPDTLEPQRRRTSSSGVTFTSDLVESETLQSSPTTSRHESAPILLENSPSTGPSLTASPSGRVASPISISPKVLHRVTRVELLSLMIKQTFLWVFGGIGVMVLGIGFAQGVILPHIYTCPPSADCPMSFDMNSTNALALLQALMQYWLQAGMLVASMGLLKLSAYQAWFIMMRDGNTMDNLDLTLGAIRGSLLDAARLTFRKRNRLLSVFVLGQLGVTTAITLIIGLSITRDKGTRLLAFNYLGNTQFPDSSIQHLNTEGQIQAIAKVNAWALSNDTTHSYAYRGSLVIPDGRNASVNLRAGGPRIKGTLSCTGFNNYTTSKDGNVTQYNMIYPPTGKQYIAIPSMGFSVSMTSVGTAVTKYLWVSNTTGRLPNATQTSDGVMNMALCTQSIHFMNDTEIVEGEQEIKPNTPIMSGCLESDPNVCVADSVSNAVVSWWGGKGTALWGVRCRGSVVGPLPSSGVLEEDNCALTEELWTETVTSMLDGIVQTGTRSLDTSQKLVVPVATLNARRWWLQALIPCLALILYGVGLYYTASLSQGRNVLKKLNLAEVIGAAQTDHVRNLLDSGNLEKTRMQYGSETGFVIPNHIVGSRALDGRN
ncbi:hypothetical protein BDZ94DRAFT_1239268 [Collybia nuda]|uniref:Transmembrane protein n=1 Tax=Collybia nuda TaxID=64659 RepID=A0A9P6CBD1_9AGAR|nr:hypothetical protein BDZ94DRAFT_1239268 [Collybia nuda]